MTRKGYVKLAEGFRSGRPQPCEGEEMLRGFTLARDIVADILASDNFRFDRKWFYKACEPKE